MGLRGPKPKRREVIWSPELAYAIGLIATDGCLSNDGRHLFFVSKDIQQIKNIKKCLGLKVKIGVHKAGIRMKNRNYHRVQWGDIFLYNFLLKIGLTPNKSKTIGALVVPDKYFFDFLRGNFDGDGSFYSYFDPRWESSFMYYISFTSASVLYVEWLQKTLNNLLKVDGHITKVRINEEKCSPIYNLRFAKRESLIVMNAMYSTRCEVCLSRKRLKIVRALRIVNKSLLSNRKKLTR